MKQLIAVFFMAAIVTVCFAACATTNKNGVGCPSNPTGSAKKFRS